MLHENNSQAHARALSPFFLVCSAANTVTVQAQRSLFDSMIVNALFTEHLLHLCSCERLPVELLAHRILREEVRFGPTSEIKGFLVEIF